MTKPDHPRCAICNFPIYHLTWRGQNVHGFCFLAEVCDVMPFYPSDLIGRAKGDIPLSDFFSMIALVLACLESPDAQAPLGWQRPSKQPKKDLPPA